MLILSGWLLLSGCSAFSPMKDASRSLSSNLKLGFYPVHSRANPSPLVRHLRSSARFEPFMCRISEPIKKFDAALTQFTYAATKVGDAAAKVVNLEIQDALSRSSESSRIVACSSKSAAKSSRMVADAAKTAAKSSKIFVDCIVVCTQSLVLLFVAKSLVSATPTLPKFAAWMFTVIPPIVPFIPTIFAPILVFASFLAEQATVWLKVFNHNDRSSGGGAPRASVSTCKEKLAERSAGGSARRRRGGRRSRRSLSGRVRVRCCIVALNQLNLDYQFLVTQVRICFHEKEVKS